MRRSSEEDPYPGAAHQFDRTSCREGLHVRTYRVGARTLEVRYAGERLPSILTPAMAHLSVDRVSSQGPAKPSRPDLHIDVWESATPPLSLSATQWLRAATPVAIKPGDYVYAESGAVTMVQGNRARICFRDAGQIPPWEAAMPFRVVLNSWFQQSGGQVVHGAAVGSSQRAVLLAGHGGAGKSSTALSCLQHPALSWLSDDLCLLDLDSAEDEPRTREPHGRPAVSSLYNSIKLRRENLARFDDVCLSRLDHLPFEYGKPTFFLHPQYRHKLARRLPLQAILLPRIRNQVDTHVTPASTADAWRALVPSTLAVVIGDRQTATANMSRIVQRVPAYWLELGSDRDSIAGVVQQFLCATVTRAA